MSFTMEDFKRALAKDYFPKLSPEEQKKVLQSLPPEKQLADLSPEQVQEYLDRLTAGRRATRRKPAGRSKPGFAAVLFSGARRECRQANSPTNLEGCHDKSSKTSP